MTNHLGLIVSGLGAAIFATWLALVVVIVALRPPGQSLGDLARVFPDALRLVMALYRDRQLPGSVRWRLRVALVYNLQPINLIPDFIPVIGFADNAIVLIWSLRGTVRAAGADAVGRHWRGSPEGLVLVYRAAGLPPPATTP
jgi:uncharacterized membrane protein YkvA (DUF1232 family)